MTFRVVIHRPAHAAIAEAWRWIADRSPEVAEEWLEGIERAIASLDTLPERCAVAPESKVVGAPIRRHIYRGRGGTYRILFLIRQDVVHVIEVRHGARKPLEAQDLELPPEAADEEID